MADTDKPEPVRKAEAWLDDKTMPEGNRPKGLEDTEGPPSIDELRREQRREVEGLTFGTSGQGRGAFLGALAFGVVGAVLGLVIGFAFFDGDSPARVLMPIIIALFAAAMGFVYWGGRTPELENETMAATGEPGSSSTPRSPGNDDRGR